MIDEIAITSPDPVDMSAIVSIVINKYPPAEPINVSMTKGVINPT